MNELFKNRNHVSEAEELDIYNDRPRFALRKRGRNKWSDQSKSPGGNTGSAASPNGGTYDPGNSNSSAPFDYPPVPNQDYVPNDNFDDLPPPPPLIPYDSYNAPGSGGAPSFEGNSEFPPPTGYPPPPPEGGWDF